MFVIRLLSGKDYDEMQKDEQTLMEKIMKENGSEIEAEDEEVDDDWDDSDDLDDMDDEESRIHFLPILLFFVIVVVVLLFFCMRGKDFFSKHDTSANINTVTEETQAVVDTSDSNNYIDTQMQMNTEQQTVTSQDGENGLTNGVKDQDPNSIKFNSVEESVTAKQTTNLRSTPSQGADSKVVNTLENGDTAKRTGVSDSGWSRLDYKGQTCYAISSYITTDLSYVPPAGDNNDDGLKTKFKACDDTVTPKIEVNLRSLPSVLNPDAQVIVKIKKGETVKRTGINEEVGWSRVEYNGQKLYCISSYVNPAQ